MKFKIIKTDRESKLLKCIKSYVETDGYEESEETQIKVGELHLGCSIHCSREHYEPQVLMILDDEDVVIASSSRELTPDSLINNYELERICLEFNSSGKFPSEMQISSLIKKDSHGS